MKSYQDILIDKHLSRLKENPKDLHALLQLGELFSQKNQYKKAIKYFKKALSSAPNAITAMRGLAHSFHRTKQYGKAEKLYQKILKAEPTDSIAAFNLGVLAIDEKKSTRIALTYFNKAIKLNPKNESAHFAIGEIYKKRGNCKKAIKKYQQVLKIKKQAFIAYLPIAQCYKSLNNKMGAIKNYQTFIKKAQSISFRAWKKQILYARNEMALLSSK